MAQPAIDLTDLLDRARSRADMVGSTFWTDPELTKLAESEFRQFYLECVAKYDVAFMDVWSIATIVGQVFIQPTNPSFFRLTGVRIRNSAGFPERFLRRIDMREEPMVAGTSQTGRPRYYWEQHKPTSEFPLINLRPIPDGVYTIDLYYVPLYSLKDVITAVGSSGKAFHRLAGWDEYLIVKMAIAMKDREESDCSVLLAQAAQLYQSIEKTLAPLDASEPMSVLQFGEKGPWDQINDPYEDQAIW